MRNKNKSAIKTVCIILAVLVVTLSIGGIGYLTNWFKERPKTFTVKSGETLIVRDCRGMIVKADSNFKVKSLTGETVEYTVRIYAECEERNNFVYTVSGQPYNWYDAATGNKKELTEYFGIEETPDGFILKRVSLPEILKERHGKPEIELPSTMPEADIYRMEITVGSSVMKISFRPYEKVTGIALPDNKLIF